MYFYSPTKCPKICITNIENNGSFFRLNVIRRVLENFDHFWGLFNHSTLSGICQIVSFFFNSYLSSQPVSLQERLIKLTELEIFDENRAIKNTFLWYCIWFYSQKKNWGKK